MSRWALTFTGRQANGRDYSASVETDSLFVALWHVASCVVDTHLRLRPFWKKP